MYRTIPVMLTATLIALCTICSSVYAQGAPREKFRDRIETLTMWRMMQALDLNDETAEKILEVRRKFLSRRKELRKSLAEDFKNLRNSLKDTQDKENDKQLAATIENIRSKRKELRSLWERQFDDVAKILPVRKQAELVIFMKDFRKEIRSMIRSQRRHEGRRFHRGFDRGPGPGNRPGMRPGSRMGRPYGPPQGPPPGPPEGRPPGPPHGPPGPSAQWDASDEPANLPGE